MLGNFGDKREGQSKNDTRGTSHSAAETREIGSSSSFGEKPQSPASLDAFVTATSAEAVSLVGRSFLALGNAVVDGIEGTADFVHNAAKQADRIANRVSNSPSGGRNGQGGGFSKVLSNLSPTGGRSRGSPGKSRSLSARSPLKGFKKGNLRSPSKAASKAALVEALSGSKSDEWGWGADKLPSKDELRGAVSSAVAHYRRELDSTNNDNKELREDLSKLRAELLEKNEEVECLKKQNLGLQRRQAQRDHDSEATDPLAEQVRNQLTQLVTEKGLLKQENDLLWRENESLQELLMHSNMAATAEAMYQEGGALADLVGTAQTQQLEFEGVISEVDGKVAEKSVEEVTEGVTSDATSEVTAEVAPDVDLPNDRDIPAELQTELAVESTSQPLETVPATLAEAQEVDQGDGSLVDKNVDVADTNVESTGKNLDPIEGKENVQVKSIATADANEAPAAKTKGGKMKKGRKGKK